MRRGGSRGLGKHDGHRGAAARLLQGASAGGASASDGRRTGQVDKETGEPVELDAADVELVQRIEAGQLPWPSAESGSWLPGELWLPEKRWVGGALSGRPEPKRRFVASRNEQRQVLRRVRMLRRLGPRNPLDPLDPLNSLDSTVPTVSTMPTIPILYDLWENTMEAGRVSEQDKQWVQAPKMALPTHRESYNPPEEYLLSKEEAEKWKEEGEKGGYLPVKYRSLREVPGYEKSMYERFEREEKSGVNVGVQLNIDPESLIPKLPLPEDLRPFPTGCSIVYKGHKGCVRSISIDPNGLWLASGGDDGTVRVWEAGTGKEVWSAQLGNSDGSPVDAVSWRPIKNADIILASCGSNAYMLSPHILSDNVRSSAKEFVSLGFNVESSQTTQAFSTWSKPDSKQIDKGVVLLLGIKKRIRQVIWHRHGDYFVTITPENGNTSVLVHLLSKHQSQVPFKKTKGLVQTLAFHPTKPILFVATQRYVKVYNLVKQELIKIIQPGLKWISSIDIHPQGDNIIIGSYDKKLAWVDMDLSSRPYKTLCYHTKALRSVAFHKGSYPLFCSASDDGTIHIFHGMVYNDLMQNALLVPLKILKGHEIKHSLGVFNVQWHPKQPWLFSSGADATIRLWT
ncbi:hypothetical protein PORY_002167 [Pneumocystis oryctolagi]|uniref:Uncharacterized protein n=1 Tax=Pneumocystis oryctolagi TaxID=42067 RepID=A0ACB7C9R6_9ASCO|nr:hypothetical protein PORY_002167 [Pneumocystis oryctolagi]